MFIEYIWINKIYDSDDVPLTQIVLQRTTGVNTEDKDAEDDEDEENDKDNITSNHTSIMQKKYVGIAEDLDDKDKV